MSILNRFLIPPKRVSRLTALLLFACWFALAAFLVLRHDPWRDEVRALSVSIEGENIAVMLRQLHGEGHPAVWYLILRGAHAIFGTPQSIQIAAIAVAAASILLLVLRSPFSAGFIAVLLFTRFAVFDYAAMARNYGISMLALFAFAALYRSYRRRTLVLGGLLFLLVSCNAHSVILGGALLLFWLLEIYRDDPASRPAAFRVFALNAVLAIAGMVLSYFTVFPTYNDGVTTPAHASPIADLLLSIVLPASQFVELSTPGLERFTERLPFLLQQPWVTVIQALGSLILFGTVLGLKRRPAAVIAALASLFGFSLLFAFIYPGGYRHQALWLVFIVTLYWIVAADPRDAGASAGRDRFAPLGIMALVLALVLQWPLTVLRTQDAITGTHPASRARDFARLMEHHPELHQSVILADPDYLVETIPYYMSNPTYFMREQRFGRVVHFTRTSQLQLSLDRIIEHARRLRAQTGHPVVILLTARLDRPPAGGVVIESYNWRLVAPPEQVLRFRDATKLLASYPPAATDESFDVYTLN